MIELARTVLELTESNSELVFEKLPSDDPMMREPDIALAKSLLSWNPSVTLRDGLTQTISYFNSELRN
jgi:UDP-glucuronate decarboxylase